MATRDPNFWKRFSIAVHQDDLLKSEMSQHSPEHRDLKHSDSWLVSQRRKARQRTWMCWLFWTGILTLVAAVVVTILVLKARRIL